MHSLGINQKVDSFVFSLSELQAKLGLQEKFEGKDIFSPFFKIVVSYADVEGNDYSDESTIDFAELKGHVENYKRWGWRKPTT